MQSNVKTAGSEKRNNFTITPFAEERERWEEYERAIRLMIERNIDVPTEWNNFLFTEFPGVPNRPDEFILPEEFDVHPVPPLLSLNATPVAQKPRMDLIKIEKEYNAKVGKAISIHTGILYDTCCDSSIEVFVAEFAMVPYAFFRYMKRMYGPESNVHEDRSNSLHKIIKLKKALKSLQKSEDLIIFINVANTRKTTIPRPTEPATIFQVGICR
jgi:hypothetical protein